MIIFGLILNACALAYIIKYNLSDFEPSELGKAGLGFAAGIIVTLSALAIWAGALA